MFTHSYEFRLISRVSTGSTESLLFSGSEKKKQIKTPSLPHFIIFNFRKTNEKKKAKEVKVSGRYFYD